MVSISSIVNELLKKITYIILYFRPPPTLWEAAADAIVEQKSFNTSVDIFELETNDHTNSSGDTVIETQVEDSTDIKEKLYDDFFDDNDEIVNGINKEQEKKTLIG
jgi:hypothetical protein